MLSILIFIISSIFIVWLVFFIIGMKVGIGFLLDSLIEDGKLSEEEYAQFSSWKFIKKSLLSE